MNLTIRDALIKGIEAHKAGFGNKVYDLSYERLTLLQDQENKYN